MSPRRTRAGRFGPPKSGKRLIDLDETLVGKLEVHIKKMRKEGMAEGKLTEPLPLPGDHAAHDPAGHAAGL